MTTKPVTDTTPFRSRPGIASLLASEVDFLLSTLERIDAQLVMCNNALNAAQRPANGKLGIAFDPPGALNVSPYPRLVAWSRFRNGKWKNKAIGNKFMVRKARSSPEFHGSFLLVQEVLREADKLVKLRKSLMDKLTTVRQQLLNLEEMTSGLAESERFVGVLYKDALTIMESGWELNAMELGY